MDARRLLGRWMGISAFLYATSGAFFAVAPDRVFDLIHLFTRMVGLPDSPYPAERFWLTLAISMMLMLTMCCTMVARDPVAYLDVTMVVVASKFMSTTMGLTYYLAHASHPALLMIGLTDLPLGVVTLVLYRRAKEAPAA